MSKLNFLLHQLAPRPSIKKQTRALSNTPKSPAMLIAVHGTQSNPDTWNGSDIVLNAISNYFGFNAATTLYDYSFSWGLDENGKPLVGKRRLDWLLHGQPNRKKAADLLFQHISNQYERAYPNFIQDTQLSPNERLRRFSAQYPLILVAHSHGGNVCFHLLSKLKNSGIKVYLCTIATPVYRNVTGDPKRHVSLIAEHAHFWTASDIVQGFLAGGERYHNNFSNNHKIPTKQGHSFHHREKHPQLLAACIDFYAKNKRAATVSKAFQEQLQVRFGSIVPKHPEQTIKDKKANYKAAKSFTTKAKPSAMLFAVHGTKSNPDTWGGESIGILEATANYFGFNAASTSFNTSFNWGLNKSGEPVFGDKYRLDRYSNKEKQRKRASEFLFDYIKNSYTKQYLDEADYHNRKAIVKAMQQHPLILVGHSHGGNVCIQLLSMLKALNIKAYLCTIATPVYKSESDPENPKEYLNCIIEHSHYWAQTDGVQGELAGAERYDNNISKNYKIPTRAGHYMHYRTYGPGLLADCIHFFKTHKNDTEVSLAFYEQLRSKYPKWISASPQNVTKQRPLEKVRH